MSQCRLLWASNSKIAITRRYMIRGITNVLCVYSSALIFHLSFSLSLSSSSLISAFYLLSSPLHHFPPSLFISVTVLQLARWDNSSTPRYSQLIGQVMEHRAPIKHCIISCAVHELRKCAYLVLLIVRCPHPSYTPHNSPPDSHNSSILFNG